MGTGCSRGSAKESSKDNGLNGMENLLLSDHQRSHHQQRELKATLLHPRRHKMPSRRKLQHTTSTHREDNHSMSNSNDQDLIQQPSIVSHRPQSRPHVARRAQWEQNNSGSGSPSCGSSEATSPATSPQFVPQVQADQYQHPVSTSREQLERTCSGGNNTCCAACSRARMEWDKYKPSPLLRDYAAVTTQNSKHRPYMEDECVAIPKFRAFHGDRAHCSFFGVYDGHGGGFCSKYAAENFHKRFSRILNEQLPHKVAQLEQEQDHSNQEMPGWSSSSGELTTAMATTATTPTRSARTTPIDPACESTAEALSCSQNQTASSTQSAPTPTVLASVCSEDIASCFADAYAQIDREICADDQAAACGTTAVTCLIRRYQTRTALHVANVGDSRAVYFSRGKTTRLSVDHKAINEDEVKRIRGNQGIIVNKRVAGVVSVTRAFGQADEKKFIISQPHVVTCEVDSDDAFLVLVSDGICDVYTDEELTAFVHQRLQRDEKSVTICKDLLDQAKERGAMDNMTAVVICFTQDHPNATAVQPTPLACRA